MKNHSGQVSLEKGRIKKTKLASGQFAENQLLVASSLNTSSMIDLFAIYGKFTNDDLAVFKKNVQSDEWTLKDAFLNMN